MAPEFEEAAKEMEGKVRFVKLDTDKVRSISYFLSYIDFLSISLSNIHISPNDFCNDLLWCNKHPEMAGRLNIMGLPTLLFLDQFQPDEDEEGQEEKQPQAVLKDRIEGALRKESILAMCEHHFFGGPRPEQL